MDLEQGPPPEGQIYQIDSAHGVSKVQRRGKKWLLSFNSLIIQS